MSNKRNYSESFIDCIEYNETKRIKMTMVENYSLTFVFNYIIDNTMCYPIYIVDPISKNIQILLKSTTFKSLNQESLNFLIKTLNLSNLTSVEIEFLQKIASQEEIEHLSIFDKLQKLIHEKLINFTTLQIFSHEEIKQLLEL